MLSFLLGGAVSFFILHTYKNWSVEEKQRGKRWQLYGLARGDFLWKMKKKKENATQISKTYTYEVKYREKKEKTVYKGIYDSGESFSQSDYRTGVCIIQKEQAAKLLLTKKVRE